MQFMTKHLTGPAIVLAVGLGFANAGGVAHALPQMPQIRYEVNGPAVAEFIYYQTDTGQLHQVNAPLPWSTEFTGFGGEVFTISAQGPAPSPARSWSTATWSARRRPRSGRPPERSAPTDRAAPHDTRRSR
ncbi:conserved transmembrane protein [Mycobacterium intracellulare]|nr:conserved transmembrane protein [Mycobacterium intracellulare]